MCVYIFLYESRVVNEIVHHKVDGLYLVSFLLFATLYYLDSPSSNSVTSMNAYEKAKINSIEY